MQEERNNIFSPNNLSEYDKPLVPCETYEGILWSKKGEDAMKYLLEERKLSRRTIKHFRLGATEQGEVAIPIFKNGNLIDYKFRGITAKTFRRISGAETWVINEEGFNISKEKGYIILVEGEFDAMAMWQMGFKNVISGTGGAQSPSFWVASIPDEVKKVCINYDNDEPGQEAARKLAERIGLDRCYNIVLPTKDANDFLKEGHTDGEYLTLLSEAKRFEVKDVYRIVDVLDALQNNKIQRIPTFHERFNKKMNGGIPKKSLIIVSGKSGIGKSTTVMNFLVDHANRGMPVMLISLENDIYFTLQRLIEIKYNRKIDTYTKEDYAQLRKDLIDYPFYIDTSMDRYNMDDISKTVKQAKMMYGIEFLGFDHIGWLPNRKYNVSQEVSQMTRDFKQLARDNDIIIYMVSHIRKLGKDQDFISGEDLKDSSSLQQDADIVLFVVDSSEGKQLIIDKSRMSESHLNIPISFDGETGRMSDDTSRKITKFGEEVIEPVEVYPNNDVLINLSEIKT